MLAKQALQGAEAMRPRRPWSGRIRPAAGSVARDPPATGRRYPTVRYGHGRGHGAVEERDPRARGLHSRYTAGEKPNADTGYSVSVC